MWRDERVGELHVKCSHVNILENKMERSVIYQRDLQVLNTADVVDRCIDKIGVIAGVSLCPAGVVLADVVDSFIQPKIISTK